MDRNRNDKSKVKETERKYAKVVNKQRSMVLTTQYNTASVATQTDGQ